MPRNYTRVYTDGGTVVHLLNEWDSPNKLGVEALCGRSAWPSYWYGTGTQEEYERALDLRLCTPCEAVQRHRENGEVER